MNPSPNTIVDENTFYKRLVLLSSLHALDRRENYRINRLRGPSQPSRNTARHPSDSAVQDEEQDIKLRKFLDRLAEVCASTRAGDTVTAVTVHLSENSPCPEYVFVSNNQSPEAARDAKIHIESILTAFWKFQECSRFTQQQNATQDAQNEVLRRAVWFNKSRLRVYLNIIEKNLETLSKRSWVNMTCLVKKLIKAYKDKHEKNFVDLTIFFVQKLRFEEFLKLDGTSDPLNVQIVYQKRVEGTKGLRKKPHPVLWHKVQHALKRFSSLHDAVEIFAATAIDWPQLFRDPVVRFLESSPSIDYGITTLGNLESEYFFENLGLDASTTEWAKSRPCLGHEIKRCIQGNRNGRRIHAEVQLWIHTRTQGSEHKFVPFRPGRPHTRELSANYRVVIGVSKLTCRLCHWYFQALGPHRVAIRSSSLNVYDRWALPSLAVDHDIPRVLYHNLADELSRVLGGGQIHRTETDTDSEPNSPDTLVFSDTSSYTSSERNVSGNDSGEALDTSSTESVPDCGKSDSERSTGC